MGRVWTWFVGLPALAKVALVGVILIASVIASPVILILSIIALPFALLWLLIVLLTRKPAVRAIVFSGASLTSLIVFAILTATVYGGDDQESAEANTPPAATSEVTNKETTTEESKSEPEKTQANIAPESERNEEAQEKTAPETTKQAPEPLTPQEALTKRIKNATGLPKEVTALKVKQSSKGCFNVSVNFTAEGVWDSRAYVEATEDNMYWIYEAAYKSGNPPVCNVATNGYSSFVDEYGNQSLRRTYSTEMGAATGQKINWNYVLTEEVSALWTETYVSPMFTQQKAENQARKAVDCMKDDGLFDVDWDC